MMLRYLFITVLFSLALDASGANREKLLEYTVNQGLSQHSVTCITQDSKDMLWIGTFDGLNRFDGREFTTYRHIPGDSTSIISNRVIAITHDKTEGLWILFANNHLGKYLGNDTFANYRISDRISDLGNGIRSMLIVDRHIIITGNRSEIVIFPIPGKETDEKLGTFKQLTADLQQDGHRILSVDNNDGRLWISSTAGVYCIVEEKVQKITGNYSDCCLKSFDDGHIILWQDQKVIISKASNGTLENPALSNIAEIPVASAVNTVCYGHNNDLWIAAIDGLYKYHNMQLTYYPPSSRIRTVLCDNMGVIWGGGGNGLISINPYSQPIYNQRFTQRNSSPQNHVNNLCPSLDGTALWVGTRHTGLNYLEITYDSAQNPAFIQKKHYFDNENITLSFPFSKDSILIGMNHHLKMLVRKNGEFIPIDIASDPTWEHPFKALQVEEDILFCSGAKLYKLLIKNKETHVSEATDLNSRLGIQSIITTMVKEPDSENIWIGTRGDGVFRINTHNNQINHISDLVEVPLKSPYVWHLFFDSDGSLWIGTDTGLHYLNRNTDESSIKVISANDGLINDKIETIEEDSRGQIWAGTSQGIICYNPYDDIIKTYGYEDGFQSNNFTSTSTVLPGGYLVFGGINGFSYFNPGKFQSTSVAPSIHIERIMVGGVALDENKWDKIKVKDTDNHIRIDLCSYYSPNPTKIHHRFSINNSEWNSTADKTISLTNLKPGKYNIGIQSLTDMDTVSEIKTISFQIMRPRLLSIAAIIIYIFTVCIIILIIIRTIIYRNSIAQKLYTEGELRKAEQAMANQKLSFYTNMAHEIKTPLTLILGRVYDIQNSEEASPLIIKNVKYIEENANVIKELAEQILEYKRAISGKLKLDLHNTDIIPEIRKIVDNYTDYAEKRGISLRLESSSESMVKRVDMQKLIRVLYNLLSNAIKFSAHGDSVLVKVVDKKDNITLTVSDTGSGITEEDLPHIFERFYKAGKNGGSGIGLAFTKSLIELMGGTINASSKIGEGTTFIVSIPVEDSTEENASCHSVSLAIPPMTSSIPNILLVEDNVELNDYITEILSVRFKVHKAYNAQEAIDRLHKKDIDIIICDVMMEGTDGLTLIKKIKGIKGYSHIPTIILSAKSDLDDQLMGLNTGAVDYITKPFNPNILIIKIQNILNQYYLSKKNFNESSISPLTEITNSNRDEAFINKARDLIYKKLSDENFGVNALSQEMGISRVHLTREFHRILNQTPSVFIKRIRLNHARTLLESGNISIKECLWEIGIRSHSGFTKAFKDEFGICPADLQKNKTKNTTL